jgi:hypothetical protein
MGVVPMDREHRIELIWLTGLTVVGLFVAGSGVHNLLWFTAVTIAAFVWNRRETHKAIRERGSKTLPVVPNDAVREQMALTFVRVGGDFIVIIVSVLAGIRFDYGVLGAIGAGAALGLALNQLLLYRRNLTIARDYRSTILRKVPPWPTLRRDPTAVYFRADEADHQI